jgi:hypothetical protein
MAKGGVDCWCAGPADGGRSRRQLRPAVARYRPGWPLAGPPPRATKIIARPGPDHAESAEIISGLRDMDEPAGSFVFVETRLRPNVATVRVSLTRSQRRSRRRYRVRLGSGPPASRGPAHPGNSGGLRVVTDTWRR